MQNKKLQRGVSLITAIFLLVVVVSLGALMMTFFTAQQQGSGLDMVGARAYQASRAGIELGTFRIIQSQVNGTFASACQNGAYTSSVPYTSSVSTANTPLSPYSLVISCYSALHTESGVPVWAYSLTATASGVGGAAPGDADYVERVTQATIWQ